MVSAGRTTLFIIWEASQTDALPALFRPPPQHPPHPPHPRPLCFAPPLPLMLSWRPGPRYELFPESVTGVIESALSSLSAKY